VERITLRLRGADGRERSFVAAQDTTLAHDVWLMRVVDETGLHEALRESPKAVLSRALNSGRVFELLAGSVVEPGVPFTEAAMAERVKWLAAITDPDSKRQVRDALLMLLLSFFLSGTASSPTSPSSSAPAESLSASPSESAPSPVPMETRETSENRAPGSSSETGIDSSGSSPAATPSA
jgi:hypothetical protein